MSRMNLNLPNKQTGLAALVTAVVLLIAITIVIIFSAKFGLQELRISANEARHKEAQQLADAALEQAASFLTRNKAVLFDGTNPAWIDCGSSAQLQATFPCTVELENLGATEYDKVLGTVVAGPPIQINPPALVDLSVLKDVAGPVPTAQTADGSSSRSYILFESSADGDTLTAVGVGIGKDGTAYSAAKLDYTKIALVTPGEIPPVMAPELDLNGNFTIVANPNNGPGTTGVPISGWTENETSSGTGSWQTCHLGDFQDGGQVCSDIYTSGDDWSNCACVESISNKDEINYDIYEDTGFPDPLAYLFGTNDVNEIREIIRGAGGKVYEAGEGCTGLAALNLSLLGVPMVFVEDDCSVPAVGSIDVPVILVVNGKMTINATTDAWGILVSVTEVQSNGAAIIHGSLVAAGQANLANGGYKQVYTPEIFENLSYSGMTEIVGKVPYSWTDLVTNLPAN